MLLSVGPTPEFLKFIQIIFWILLPILVSAVLVTLFAHYRKKKKGGRKTKTTEDEFIQASPEQVGYTKGDGEYVLFDHSQLIQEYKNRLSSTHARFKALQHDFTAMESKYSALAMYTKTLLITNKTKTMENLQQQMPKDIQEEINQLSEAHAREKKEWLASLEQEKRLNQNLEQENRALLDKMNIQTGTGDEKAAIIQRWAVENAELRNKLARQEYMKDVLEENKAQIGFLQQQLEQRIKNQHEAEQQKEQLAAEIQQMKDNSHFIYQQTEVLKSELQLKQDHVDKLETIICEKEERLAEKEQMLLSKQNHITNLEHQLHESKEHNELTHASAADSHYLLNSLQQQLSDEQARVQSLEQKLLSNKQTMRRLYKEFSAGMEDENEISPVIALRPDYGSREKEETAVQ